MVIIFLNKQINQRMYEKTRYTFPPIVNHNIRAHPATLAQIRYNDSLTCVLLIHIDKIVYKFMK